MPSPRDFARRDPPGVPRGVFDAANPIAPGLIRWLPDRFGPETESAMIGRIDIGNVKIDGGRHRRIGEIAAAEKQVRIADFCLGVKIPGTVGSWSMRNLGAERVLEKIAQIKFRVEVGRDRTVAFLDVLGIAHRMILSSGSPSP